MILPSFLRNLRKFNSKTQSVCSGAGTRRIPIYNYKKKSTHDDKDFGETLCKEMGYSGVRFLGPRNEYYGFMQKEGFDIPKLSQKCEQSVPKYMIAGFEPCTYECPGSWLNLTNHISSKCVSTLYGTRSETQKRLMKSTLTDISVINRFNEFKLRFNLKLLLPTKN